MESAPPPPSAASAVPVFFGTNPSKYNSTPRAQQYSEIFDSSRPGRACSIPLLDLPPFDDSSAALHLSPFLYSQIFRAFDIADFAPSCDQLFRHSEGPQLSSQSDPWILVGTKSQSEESDPSTCTEINNYTLNGDFHQTAASKFKFSYQKVDMLSSEDSSGINMPQLNFIPRRSHIYEPDLQAEVVEIFSSEIANDIIFPGVSSELSIETQTKSAFVASHGSFKENGRPYGISLVPTVMSESGLFPTKATPHAPQYSTVNSMSEYESPKRNSAKSLFDVSPLEFLNAEFDTGSSGIASAGAIREAIDTAKVNMNSVRKLMEIKKDGVRPSVISNMNGTERVRMVFHESVSRDEVLQPKHACDHNLFKISGIGMQDVSEASQGLPDYLRAEKHNSADAAKPPHQSTSGVACRKDNGRRLKDANHLEDMEEACTGKRTEGRKRMKSPRGPQENSDMCLKKSDEGSGKRKNEMCEKEERETKSTDIQEIEQCQNFFEAATISDCYEKKCIHSVEKKIYEKREVSTTNNRTEQKVDECEDLNFSNLRARLDDKSIKQTAIASDSHDMLKNHVAEVMLIGKRRTELRSENVFGDMESKRGEVDSNLMSLQHLQQTASECIVKESKLNHQIQSMSSDVSQRVGHEVRANNVNLDPEDIQNSGKFRSKNQYQREHLRELEQEREKEQERELEWEKIKKLPFKKLKESRERKREKELDKDSPEKKFWEVDVEWEQEREREREREREKEKDRMSAGCERTFTKADDMAKQAEARKRAMAKARERLEKACADAREKKSLSKKASTEACLRAEHIAAAESRECAIPKAMANSNTFEAREQAARSASKKISRDLGFRHTSSSSDLGNSCRIDVIEGDLGQRSRARLERHRQTVEHVAKALAEKSAWDLISEKEQAEKNCLAESLDGDIRRWSEGKEGNLRALLSTLQYILGPDSGWHSIPLAEIIAPDAVKKAYRKATLCVHPDKLQQRGATMHQKYICEKVFDLLKDCWNKFKSEER